MLYSDTSELCYEIPNTAVEDGFREHEIYG